MSATSGTKGRRDGEGRGPAYHSVEASGSAHRVTTPIPLSSNTVLDSNICSRETGVPMAVVRTKSVALRAR